MTVRHENYYEKAPPCPNCGSTDTVPIIYGLPAEEAFEEEREGKVVLGGCIIFENSPKWHCKSCGYEWGRHEAEQGDED